MLTLSIDTSGDICSVSLGEGARELSTFDFRHDRHLSERLPEIVRFVLADRGASLTDLEAVAAGRGPGSFTGVRVGVTFCKTLAYALRLPLVGISSLDAFAGGVPAFAGIGIAAVAPTRHTEVVAAYYHAGETLPVGAPLVTPNATVIEQARERLGLSDGQPLLILGEVAGAVQRDTPDSAKTGALFRTASVSAAAVGRLAAERLERGDRDDAFTLTPLYVTPTPVG